MSLTKDEILFDYKTAYQSRQASLAGRKEVLGGKAKFGIFGDGKEVAQVAMARAFRKGDWRSGYYRDQTFMFALGASNVREFFAQLYADTNIEHEPASGGRQMNCHFGSRFLDHDGTWKDQMQMHNIASDLSPTAGQMSRLVGLGYASKLYRQQELLQGWAGHSRFSSNGDEVAFGTIGNASTSEGIFWEAINAAGVLQIPLAMSIWDDEYGISVPAKYQTTKESISEILAGFKTEGDKRGVELYSLKGWDYPALLEGYKSGVDLCRKDHTPVIFHISEMTQPQGHSTSGSHERYKSKDRLAYEDSIDCIAKMRDWIVESSTATDADLLRIEEESRQHVEAMRKEAWENFLSPILEERDTAVSLLKAIGNQGVDTASTAASELEKLPTVTRRDVQSAAVRSLFSLQDHHSEPKSKLIEFCRDYAKSNNKRYSSHLHLESDRSCLKVPEVKPTYGDTQQRVDGRGIIQEFFDLQLAKDPRLFVIGEDVGLIGGVNAEFEGLQAKHGELRVSDTGIREATILGQGVGAAMRGLRPVIEIQYLDYLLYCFQAMSDDLATLHYRSAGGQIAPCIIRTRGHRLEGIWHTGSPISMILGAVRGMHVCVPRNCAQAAGMYKTLFEGDEPALVIEVLSGFRVKEPRPENLGEYNVPLGLPEVLKEGQDLTIVTYGPNVRIAQSVVGTLEKLAIDVEIIDVQTLLPFDRNHRIRNSIEKTNAVLFFDEDVPGGASAYMMQQVLEKQRGYDFLDAQPRCLSAMPHRSAYSSDGDYFSKPNGEDLVRIIYEMMHERDPGTFPPLFDAHIWSVGNDGEVLSFLKNLRKSQGHIIFS